MAVAYVDVFRRITLQPDGVTLVADEIGDTLTITRGTGVAFNPNAASDSFEIDVDYELFVPPGSTEIRLTDVNSNYTGVRLSAGSNITLGRNSDSEITITSTVGGTSKAVSNASQTNPVVITTNTAHQFTEGIAVTITDVVGMTELNGNEYFMDIQTSTTFALYEDANLTTPLDGTGFTAYISGGVATAEYGAPQTLGQLTDVDMITDPPVAGDFLTYNGTAFVPGNNITSNMTGSVFADDSTLLVDGVNAIIPKAVVEDSANWDTAYGWGDHSAAGYLTSASLSMAGNTGTGSVDISGGETFTILGTTGQVDVDVSAFVASISLASTIETDLQGSVFADDSTLLIDGVNAIIPSANISGSEATNWDTAYGWGDHSAAGYLSSNPPLDDVLTAGNSSATGIQVGPSVIGGIDITGTTIDTTDSSLLTITPGVRFDTEITVSDIVPSVDGAIDLGSSTNQFRAIHSDNFNTGVGGYVNAQYVRIGPNSTYTGILYPQSTGSWTWSGFMDPGSIFHNRATSYVRWKSTGQLVYNHTNPSGTTEVDFLDSDTHYFYQPSGALTVNFTNIPTGSSRMFNMRIYIAQGATAYLPTSVQVNGAAETIEWQNGVTPTGTPSNIDFVQFLIWSFGSNNFTVLGQANSYS